VSLRTIVLIAAAIGLAVGITAIISRRPRLVIEPARIYLAFLPFENRTGEPELDWMISGIPDNLTADLAQSRFFRVMSLERLHQVFSDIGRDLEDVGTAEAMDLLGKATDLDAVAIGSFVKAGGEIRITMKIEDPQDQEVIGSAIVDDAESRLLDLIDQLTVETKQIFKLSQEDIDQDLDRGVGFQRTRSVKAASEFSKGLEHSYAGAFLDAAEAFGEAVEADPDFAMAYAKASEAYKTLGYDEKAESLSLIAVDKVIEFTDRVPPADRTFILANHADLINNVDQAIESYKEFTEAYPDNPEGYYKLGLTYESIGEWDLAVGNLRRALDLDPKFGAARFELGKVLIRKDDLELALAELRHLLAYYEDIGNREGEATVLNAIGVVHRRRNEFEEAITYFEISIAIKEELGDKRGVAASLGNLGLIYKTTGDMDRALDVLQRSLEIKREIGDKLGISTALNKIGQIYQWDCRYEEALSYYERGYEIRKDLGVKQLMASSLSDMATIVHICTGDYEKAFELDSTALALRREIGDDRGAALSLGNIAAGLSSRGRFEEASANLREGLAIARDLDDERQVAALNYQLGRDCASRGKVDSALIYYSEVLDTFEALDVKPQIATTLASRATAYQLRGEYTQALKDFDRARHLGETAGKRSEVVNALLGKTRFFIDLGYWVGCDSILVELDSYSDEALSYGQRWELKLQKARRLHAGGELPPASDLAEEIAADTRLTEIRIEAILLLAEIMFEQGSVADAMGQVDRAIEEARTYAFRRHEAEGLRLRAHMLSSEGATGNAAGICDDALGITAGLGIDQHDFLISCGDMRVATGEYSEALSFYTRGLDRAAAIVREKCPAWLGTYYIEQERISHYARLVEDLNARSGGSVRLPDYEAVFGLE
jgi:tetratricopeptide (TPR) repeat protein